MFFDCLIMFLTYTGTHFSPFTGTVKNCDLNLTLFFIEVIGTNIWACRNSRLVPLHRKTWTNS
jgi:hypothetical protein